MKQESDDGAQCHREKRSVRSNRSKRSNRKQYEDMDHGDLEKQMKDEQERPLGALVGDWQAKGRGVDDGAVSLGSFATGLSHS